MNSPVSASPTPHENTIPKQPTARMGQQNGVRGHREGRGGNRRDANPDGSRKNKKT